MINKKQEDDINQEDATQNKLLEEFYSNNPISCLNKNLPMQSKAFSTENEGGINRQNSADIEKNKKKKNKFLINNLSQVNSSKKHLILYKNFHMSTIVNNHITNISYSPGLNFKKKLNSDIIKNEKSTNKNIENQNSDRLIDSEKEENDKKSNIINSSNPSIENQITEKIKEEDSEENKNNSIKNSAENSKDDSKNNKEVNKSSHDKGDSSNMSSSSNLPSKNNNDSKDLDNSNDDDNNKNSNNNTNNSACNINDADNSANKNEDNNNKKKSKKKSLISNSSNNSDNSGNSLKKRSQRKNRSSQIKTDDPDNNNIDNHFRKELYERRSTKKDLNNKDYNEKEGDMEARQNMINEKKNKIFELLKYIKYDESSSIGILIRKTEIIGMILCFISICSIILSIIDYEIYIKKTNKYIDNYMKNNNLVDYSLLVYEQIGKRKLEGGENAIKIINCIICVIGCIFIVYKYQLIILIKKLDKNLSIYDNIITSNYYIYALRDIILCLLHPFPFVNKVYARKFKTTIYFYSLSGIFTFLSFFKLFFAVSYLISLSKYNTIIGKPILKEYHINSVNTFIIKSEIKNRSIYFKFLCVAILVILSVLAVRNFEFGSRDLYTGLEGNNGESNLSNFFNCFWMILMTITSIGYGDNFPRTILGRFLTIFTHLAGVTGFGICFLSLTNYLDFNSDEEKVYAQMKKIFDPENKEYKSANVVKTILMMNKENKKFSDRSISEINCIKFMLILKLKTETRIFKDDFLIARAFSIPINDLVKSLEDKLTNSYYIFKANLHSIKKMAKALEPLRTKQNEVVQRIQKITEKQKDIGNYFLSIYNYSFNSKKRNVNIKKNQHMKHFKKSFLKKNRFVTTQIKNIKKEMSIFTNKNKNKDSTQSTIIQPLYNKCFNESKEDVKKIKRSVTQVDKTKTSLSQCKSIRKSTSKKSVMPTYSKLLPNTLVNENKKPSRKMFVRKSTYDIEDFIGMLQLTQKKKESSNSNSSNTQN